METVATKHLWEVDHAYYCNEGNYYSNDCHFEYKTWGDFLSEMGEADLDYNLVYRWDWREGEDHGAGEYKGDDYYRNGRLLIFYMQQRKARATSCEISVCRADEPAVIEYLRPRMDYLLALWEPLKATNQEPQA